MSQFHSISISGMALFDRPIHSMIGGLTIDLASAPLAAGQHRLELDVTVGGIEIYVPHYVQFTMEGGAVVGGYDVHDGGDLGTRILRWFRIPTQIPTRAVANPDPANPPRLHFVIDGGVGGVDVYRLRER